MVKSFIVGLWSGVFNALRWVSPFQAIRKVFPGMRRSYRFVDCWVLGNLLASVGCLVASSAPGVRWWEIVILCYGGTRIFEIVVYQANVLLFDQYRARRAGQDYGVRGYRRLVLLLLHNYVEILFWFSAFYRNFSCVFDSRHILLDSVPGSLYFSVVTMATLGYGDITPKGTAGLVLATTQTLTGVFMAVVMLAKFISLMPKPKTLDELETTED